VFYFTGLGLSITYIGTLTSVAQYFDGRSKCIALSFVTFASGVGSIIFPPLLNLLVDKYGWRGCLLIISGIVFNLVPCFAICKPRIKSNKQTLFNDNTSFKEDKKVYETMMEEC